MNDGSQSGISRRRYLAGAGAAGTAALAGCLGFGGGGGVDSLTVAYMPIYPDFQYFVMEAEGYFDDVSVPVEGREFSDGPSIVQAYASGELDIAMFGIVPSMILIDRGIPAKVVATNITEPMMIMAHEEFRAMWADEGPDAFGTWEAEKGRKFRFGTFPQGSVPDILLRYWLTDVHGVDPEEDVEILEIGGAQAVWQAIANGEIDGTSIMEPVPTIAAENDSPVGRLAIAGEFMPGQPAAVTLMNDDVRGSDVGREFVEQHVRATEFIDANPDRAAQAASSVIGEQSLPVDRARRALDSPLSNFVTDPHAIDNGTEIFARKAAELGRTDERLTLEQIFDYSVYERL